MKTETQMFEDTLYSDSTEESANQYLTFLLNGEEYGVEILKVQEIKSWGPYTPLPKSPAHVLGVINLRGAIVPIIDLRVRLGLPTTKFNSTTAIIIVEVEYDNRLRTIGLVVDSVSEVYQLLPAQIQEASEVNGIADPQGFIEAFGRAEEKLLILINLDPIVRSSLELTPDIEV